MHKWQSNEPELEDDETVSDDETTFAKQKFGNDNQTKLLGLIWDKEKDTLSVKIPETSGIAETKRGVLKFLAAIYDPIGPASPVILCGKVVFRDICLEKYGWDTHLTGDILKRWRSFLINLPTFVTIKRALVPYREEILYVDLHSFGDASKVGTAAVVYAVIYQPSGVLVL